MNPIALLLAEIKLDVRLWTPSEMRCPIFERAAGQEGVVVSHYSKVAPLVALIFAVSCNWAIAQDASQQNDLLNAEVWMQTAVEYRANCLTIYALAKHQLDEAVSNNAWSALGQDQSARDLPTAVILDLDETALDNSPYQAGLVVRNQSFNPKSWNEWVQLGQAKAIPGALDFTQYAASKSVKVFYVSNRTADQKDATRRNLTSLGFPITGNVETLLFKRDRPEWSTESKLARFAMIAKDYRVLLLFGDNIGDFSDLFGASIGDRDKGFESIQKHFGHDWMMLPNPSYGSWESAAYDHNFKLSAEEKHARKLGVLAPWPSRQ